MVVTFTDKLKELSNMTLEKSTNKEPHILIYDFMISKTNPPTSVKL